MQVKFVIPVDFTVIVSVTLIVPPNVVRVAGSRLSVVQCRDRPKRAR